MALVRAKAAKSNPDAVLSAALNDFKTVLTEEQSRQFNTTLSPDTNDAVRLATQIDHENTNRWGRCLGPRLVTFLESVQQFSKILDTFVSSNPEIAALLWGGVKLCLLLVNNFTSYFDKLSSLFMQIGRSCPRLAEFGALYKTSLGLQKSLCEYYAIVVRLCKLAVEFARKSYIVQATSAILQPFDMQFGPFQKQLLELSQVIRDEVSLASKKAQAREVKLQAKERQMALRQRILGENFQRQVLQEQREAKLRESQNIRLRVLDSISVYDFKKSWKYSRRQCLRGTSLWIFERVEWKDWLLHTSSASLCCTGNLGSGKTVITACVVAHLLSEASGIDSISYFFCRYDDPESLTTRAMVGSIARQLLSDLPLEVFTILNQEIQDTKPDGEWLFEVLASRLSTDRQYFIVLDGLNEFEDADIKEVVYFLERLLALPTLKIKIFYSIQGIRLPVKASFARHIAIDESSISSDINQYIDVILEHHLENGTLQLGNPGLKSLIQRALKEGARGMFLWVVFQIENICAQQSDEQILEAIMDLPRDLPKTFERILKKLSTSKNTKVAGRIFNWLAVAKRPLMLEELREAIAIDPLQKELVSARLVNNMMHALSCCGSLVVIDEEQRTVHFTHHSVWHHLTQGPSDLSLADYYVDLEAADTRAGEICVTYLSFNAFDRRLTKAPTKGTNTANIPGEIVREMLPRTRLVHKLTSIRFLKDKESLNSAIERQMEEALGRVQQQYFFLLYARKWWIFHTKGLQVASKPIWDMWCRLLIDENGNADKPWPAQERSHGVLNKHMVEWANLNDHEALFVYIGTSNQSIESLHIKEISMVLVKYRRWRDLRRFLELNSHSEHAMQDDLRTEILVPAVWYDQVEIVQLCLTDGADVYKTHTSIKLTEYNITMAGPSFNINEYVDQDFPDLKNWQKMLDSWSPLGIAAAARNLDVIKFILSKGYKEEILAPSNLPQALLVAAALGHFEIAHHLLHLKETLTIYIDDDDEFGHKKKLPRRFPLDVKDNHGWTALMYITAWGNLELVEMLLRRGANPEIMATKDNRKPRFSPFTIAESTGRNDIQDLLLSWRAKHMVWKCPESHLDNSESYLPAMETYDSSWLDFDWTLPSLSPFGGGE